MATVYEKTDDGLLKQIRPALVLLLLFSVVTGLLYPAVLTGIARVIFPRQANGSLIRDANGQLLGSSLIGQNFTQPQYLWGRLSATSTFPYNAFNADNLTASSGSNYGPSNPALVNPAATTPEEFGIVQQRIQALRTADPGNAAPIPVDLVTASASGLDPHISPAAAVYQIARIARARNLGEDQVRAVVARYTEGRTFGIFGEPRVNVLLVNLTLDGKLQ